MPYFFCTNDIISLFDKKRTLHKASSWILSAFQCYMLICNAEKLVGALGTRLAFTITCTKFNSFYFRLPFHGYSIPIVTKAVPGNVPV